MATSNAHSYAVIVHLRQKRFKIKRINNNKIRLINVESINTMKSDVFLFEQTLVTLLHTLFHHYFYFFLTIVLWSMVWSGPLWGHHSNTHPLTLKEQDTLPFPGIGRYHDLCSGYSLHPPAPEHDTESSWFYHSSNVFQNARYRIAIGFSAKHCIQQQNTDTCCLRSCLN